MARVLLVVGLVAAGFSASVQTGFGGTIANLSPGFGTARPVACEGGAADSGIRCGAVRARLAYSPEAAIGVGQRFAADRAFHDGSLGMDAAVQIAVGSPVAPSPVGDVGGAPGSGAGESAWASLCGTPFCVGSVVNALPEEALDVLRAAALPFLLGSLAVLSALGIRPRA